jgi:hypothetical protein
LKRIEGPLTHNAVLRDLAVPPTFLRCICMMCIMAVVCDRVLPLHERLWRQEEAISKSALRFHGFPTFRSHPHYQYSSNRLVSCEFGGFVSLENGTMASKRLTWEVCAPFSSLCIDCTPSNLTFLNAAEHEKPTFVATRPLHQEAGAVGRLDENDQFFRCLSALVSPDRLRVLGWFPLHPLRFSSSL